MSHETVALRYEEVLAKTDRAVKLLIDDEEHWFPLSQCDDLAEVEVGDEEGEFECPEWLAEEKGLA